MLKMSEALYSRPEMIPTRNGLGDGIVEAGERDKAVVALCCDLTESTKLSAFKERFPERFFEVGVAEQNMAGIGAGLSFSGKVPYIASYAVFSPGRNWDQIRVSICYNKANVKVMGCHAGISVGPDGATHQALEDIALMRVLPNMQVIVPCDYHEARKATLAVARVTGPAYVRLGREKVPVVTREETPFEIGRAETFKDGNDATVIACGPLVYEALIAARDLEGEVDVRVINMHTIKPIDEEAILKAARETGGIVTAEEHQIHGGMGSAVAEVTARHPVPLEFVGVKNCFGESGAPAELMTEYGLKSPQIVTAVREVIKRK